MVQRRCNVSPCTYHSKNPLLLWVTSGCPDCGSFHTIASLLFRLFFSQHHEALPSLNYSFPFGVNFKRYHQRNDAQLPRQPLRCCKSLLNHICCPVLCHLRHTVPSSRPKHPDNNHARKICHPPDLPSSFALFCSLHSLVRTHKTSRGLQLTAAPPSNKERRETKRRESHPFWALGK